MDGDHYRKPQSIKTQSCGVSPNGDSYRTLKLREDCGRGSRRTVRARGRRLCCDICLLVITKATPIVSPTSSPKHELNKEETNEHDKLHSEKPKGPQPYTKNHHQLSKAGRSGSSGKITPTGSPVPSGQPWKETTSNIWTHQVLSVKLYVYANTTLHTITTDENRDHEFGEAWGGLCGRFEGKREMFKLKYNLKNKKGQKSKKL